MGASRLRARGSGDRLAALALACALLVPLLPAAARADLGGVRFLRDVYYDVGASWSSGGEFRPPGSLATPISGIRIYERNGIGGKYLATALMAVLLSLGQSNYEYLGSDYGYGYSIDYYRHKSPSEMAAEQAAHDEAIDATASNDYQLDLQFFLPVAQTNPLGAVLDALGPLGDFASASVGSAKGFLVALYPWSYSWTMVNGAQAVFDLGFQLATLRGPLVPADGCAGYCPNQYQYWNVGMPLRFAFPLLSFAYLDLQWEMNFLSLAVFDPNWQADSQPGGAEYGKLRNSPLRLTLVVSPIERAYIKLGGSLGALSLDRIGFALEVGFRL